MKQPTVKALPLVLALLGAGVIGGAGVEALHGSRVYAAPAPAAAAPATPQAGANAAVTTSTGTPAVGVPDFARITEQYGPAVVNVSVTGTRKAGADSDESAAFNGDPFEFFRRFQPLPLQPCRR